MDRAKAVKSLLGLLIAFSVVATATTTQAGNWLNPAKKENTAATTAAARKERCKAAAAQIRTRKNAQATVSDVAAIDLLAWECGREGRAVLREAGIKVPE